MDIKLIGFYFSLFLFAFLIKKLFRIKIVINGIWFSTNGAISQHAVDNFLQLSQDIKKSPFRHQYQLFFWTDTNKLAPIVRKAFKKNGIKIKDYRNVHPPDKTSTMALEWIENLLALANDNNKLFFVLASDFFRLYLLLKEFPSHYKKSYTCYFDCNDIYFNNIPNPQSFSKIQTIAFHFVEFQFRLHPIFAELVDCPSESQALLTNDVIIAKNKKMSIFDDIFKNYCHNFLNIKQSATTIIELLKMTCYSMPILDDDMVTIIIFTTTHMINTLYLRQEENKLNLHSFLGDKLNKKEIEYIQDVTIVFDFERDYSKGLTCLQRENVKTDESPTEEANIYRNFWYQLFVNRYKLITDDKFS